MCGRFILNFCAPYLTGFLDFITKGGAEGRSININNGTIAGKCYGYVQFRSQKINQSVDSFCAAEHHSVAPEPSCA